MCCIGAHRSTNPPTGARIPTFDVGLDGEPHSLLRAICQRLCLDPSGRNMIERILDGSAIIEIADRDYVVCRPY